MVRPLALLPCLAVAVGLASAGANASPAADSLIYSTHVAFRGSDGHRFAGDAVVYPSWLFPVARAAAGFRNLSGARARSLSSGPFRFDSLFESGRSFDIRRPSAATLDYLLYVPGAYGTSQVPGHARWMDVESFSIGFSTVSGKLVTSDLAIQKATDATSPVLWLDVNKGTFLKAATDLTFQVWEPTSQSTGLIYMSMTFSTAVVDSYNLSASNNGPASDSVSFDYDQVDICVYPSASTGKQGSGTCSRYNSANSMKRK